MLESLYFLRLYEKITSALGFFVKFANFPGHLACRTTKNGYFCVDIFLEVIRKFEKIFKSTSEKVFLVYIVLPVILKGNPRK